MCGKCEHHMGKAGMGGGTLSMVLAVVTKLCGMHPMGVGPKSFAAASALLFLMSIAASSCHGHGEGGA